MLVPFTDLISQYHSIKAGIDGAIHSVFESGQFIGGKFVESFEQNFAALHGAGNCIGVGNGTDAILIALKSFHLKAGDEVIVPAFGWISASEMITLAGAKPIFCDVLRSGLLDPSLIEAKITPATRGVICIHLYGNAAQAHAILQICDRHSLFLIEDCAQAHLTTENTRPVGTIGNAGAFSFYPTKNLGAYGDGGCILTNDSTRAHEMRLFANHGGLHQHILEGINSRLDPLQAAILTVKCEHLQKWTDQRIGHANLYQTLLRDVPRLDLPIVRPGTRHTFHQFVIRTKKRDKLKSFLEENGIQTLIHYPIALHNLPAYRHFNFRPDDFPEATRCQEEVLSLPIFPELSSEQISFVCEKINLFLA